MTAPGLLIAAPRSGSGKTAITVGIARSLARRGAQVRCAKTGPDYIDGSMHAAATGRPSMNLDTFAMSETLLCSLAVRASADCDLLLVEGAMGLFDGAESASERTGTSAELAARFGWPVVLVLDVSGQGQTAAAVALGLARFDPRISIAGVILNKVASDRHRGLVESGFARTGIPVLGALRRDGAMTFPERHLGLVQAGEVPDLGRRLDAVADLIEGAVDLDRLVALADRRHTTAKSAACHAAIRPPGSRIALASDEAFSFVYPHVVEGWREAGATILPFSPLLDQPPPPDADCCWLPGGYPELHAGRIAAAHAFRAGLRAFAETRPVHGECGGYMVLGEALEDAAGLVHPMAGCLPVRTTFARRRLHLGYRVARLMTGCGLGSPDTVLSGHEFHYASVCEEASAPPDLATVRDARGRSLGRTGHRSGLVSGTFFHAIAQGEAGVAWA